ncbi:hypothetical protein [Dinghuibacter silviterrae]|uniref:Uncharacterized protein n=1 Tax=Dinghuibacter silviterrae TaxID=1539049 RepID=A0A4R8DIK3_9BACT|nr:hypothetical protein [Dinghuibacter silviterrae]TDW97134.1 hypothetical protein EDB95_4975 [Dinghuibacter silviterrae]
MSVVILTTDVFEKIAVQMYCESNPATKRGLLPICQILSEPEIKEHVNVWHRLNVETYNFYHPADHRPVTELPDLHLHTVPANGYAITKWLLAVEENICMQCIDEVRWLTVREVSALEILTASIRGALEYLIRALPPFEQAPDADFENIIPPNSTVS